MLTAFVCLGLAATLLGGLFPVSRLSRAGLWRLFAFRSVLLLAVTFTDLLPEAWVHHPSYAGWGAMSAFFLFYAAQSFAMVDACPEYMEECTTHVLGWAALIGLFVHSFMDGLNLAVSVSAGTAAGLAVGTALTLHKLVDGFTLTSLFRQSGYSARQTAVGLCLVAGATPLGSLVSRWNAAGLDSAYSALLLGFAAGSFIYIGTAEILPRLHKTHDRGAFVSFGAGILAMLALRQLAG